MGLWSVLEHVHDPLGTMKIIAELLKPGGYIFFGIPNYGSLERKLFRSRWFGLDVPRHLYHFTPSTVRKLMSAAGFVPVQILHASGHDTFKFSASNKRRNEYGQSGESSRMNRPDVKTASTARSWRARLNGLVVGTFTRTADMLHQGSQILVTARKPSLP